MQWCGAVYAREQCNGAVSVHAVQCMELNSYSRAIHNYSNKKRYPLHIHIYCSGYSAVGAVDAVQWCCGAVEQ